MVEAEAVPSGWVVYVSPLWRDEGVGTVWRHKQICNRKTLLDKGSYFNVVRCMYHATDLGSGEI